MKCKALLSAVLLLGAALLVLNPIIASSAESQGNFIFSALSNSIWVLNKSTRKIIFVQFKKPDAIWKSNQVTVPVDFNLDKCVLKAVGGRGTSVFLYDKSSAMATFYQVKKDHSVDKFMMVNIGEDLK